MSKFNPIFSNPKSIIEADWKESRFGLKGVFPFFGAVLLIGGLIWAAVWGLMNYGS